MKSLINLGYNNAYRWFCDNNIYVIGSIYYKGQFLSEKKFVNFVNDNLDVLDDVLKKVTGFFSIVIKKNTELILISDIMRTFPLFYQIVNEQIIISDNLNSFINTTLNETYCTELENLRYVLGDNTIYDGVSQIESNQILTIKSNLSITKSRYYDFNSIVDYLSNKKELINKIDNIFDHAVKRLIEYANGRTLVIPLSGGYDSRQILLSLHKQKYNNVICYTYGKRLDGEVLISKKIADYFKCKWFFIKYTNSKLQKLYYNKNQYKNVICYITRGYSYPHIQEWYAMHYLKKNHLIPNDSIIVPGFTGDALSGSHLEENFFNKNSFSSIELIRKIINYNYIVVNNYKESIDRVRDALNINNDILTLSDAVNFFNKYDFEERQVKYITNAVRIYEYYGYEWYLPFWDKDYIDLWKSIPLEYKFNRNLLKKYLNFKYKNVMNTIPIYQKATKKKTTNIFSKIYNILMLYYSDNMNLYGYYKYYIYLYQLFFYKNTSYDYIFGKNYIDFVKKVKK